MSFKVKCLKEGGDKVAGISFSKNDLIVVNDSGFIPLLQCSRGTYKRMTSSDIYELCEKVEGGNWEITHSDPPRLDKYVQPVVVKSRGFCNEDQI